MVIHDDSDFEIISIDVFITFRVILMFFHFTTLFNFDLIYIFEHRRTETFSIETFLYTNDRCSPKGLGSSILDKNNERYSSIHRAVW